MKNNIKIKSAMISKLFVAFIISIFLFGCEKHLDKIVDEMKDKDKKHNKEAKLFVADLHPLNNSGVTGKATFKYQKGKQFLAEVHAEGLVPNMAHHQHVHINGKCPAEDAGGEDGLLGHDELEHIVGEELFPLKDQLMWGNYPTANHSGMIRYQAVMKLNDLIAAIGNKHSEIKTMEDLKLHDRVVVLHGAYVKDGKIVAPGTEGAEYMPEIPVACGEIREAGGKHDDHGNGGGDGGGDGHSDGGGDGGGDGHSDGGGDGHSDGGGDGHSDGSGDGHSDGGSDGHSDGGSDGQGDY